MTNQYYDQLGYAGWSELDTNVTRRKHGDGILHILLIKLIASGKINDNFGVN
jgi:hypothetical protein